MIKNRFGDIRRRNRSKEEGIERFFQGGYIVN
jgi:hypothetical protein